MHTTVGIHTKNNAVAAFTVRPGGEVYTRQSGIWLNYVYWSEVELFDVLEWEK